MAVMFLLTALPLGVQAAPVIASAGAGRVQSYSNSSWALGIVVPEGAPVQGGGSLRWEGVGNVTVEVELPNITLPDRVVYAVESVMASDGSVLQAAAGAYPNRTFWLAYSWTVPGTGQGPVTYQWILNGSDPLMEPSAQVSISIYREGGVWNLRVENLDDGASVVRQFPKEVAGTLRAGDQEVFALESYSKSGSTFRTMGNLTMQAILVDDTKVTGGFYSYGDWDPTHNPVFVVGSSGTSPPIFISLTKIGTSSFAWGYTAGWVGGEAGFLDQDDFVLIVALAAVALLAVGVSYQLIVASRRGPKRAS